ncbi:MAG: hypothetical protein F6K24_14295 [Okeania sp. SIO2D1]|nr:hypothetical protein [Okeania sp. SIO2D1]
MFIAKIILGGGAAFMVKEAMGVWEDWKMNKWGEWKKLKNIYPHHYYAGLPNPQKRQFKPTRIINCFSYSISQEQ